VRTGRHTDIQTHAQCTQTDRRR